MSETKHTPTPWVGGWDYKRVSPNSDWVISHCTGPQMTRHGQRLDGTDILHPSKEASERMIADSAFMLRAVNSFDDMLAALEKAERELTNGLRSQLMHACFAAEQIAEVVEANPTIRVIRAAIAKAKHP